MKQIVIVKSDGSNEGYQINTLPFSNDELKNRRSCTITVKIATGAEMLFYKAAL